MMELGDIPIAMFAPASKRGDAVRGKVLEYLGILEGYKTKYKNLHWSAENDAIHVRIDEFLDILGDHQDEIAEAAQGIYGQFGPNELVGAPQKQTSPLEALKELSGEVQKFHQTVSEKKEYLGLLASIEGFMTQLNKFVYLFKISMK